MTEQNNEMRQWVRGLFHNGDQPVTIEPQQAPRPITGPLIPGQADAPDMTQRHTPAQKYVNRLLNAGTIREYL